MKKIIIKGPSKISGDVYIQGAKNVAMRTVLFPLLVNGVFRLENTPDNASIRSLLKIPELCGATLQWTKPNTVVIDSTNVEGKDIRIPSEIFFHTSGAVVAIPILVSRYGECRVEKDQKRSDTGGDKIGRNMDHVFNTYEQCGVKTLDKGDHYLFQLESDKPFSHEVYNKSYGASVVSILSALFKEGTSLIKKPTEEAEFDDVIRFLKAMGANIKSKNGDLEINGSQELNPINFKHIYDRHDFATWVSLALATNSDLKIHNVDYGLMKLESMQGVLDQMGAKLHFNNNICHIKPQLENLKSPKKIMAGIYPMFQTEWQVLFSPLISMFKGKTEIVETYFTNRIKNHWLELGKMGAKFQFVKNDSAPEDSEENPRAVVIDGPTEFKSTEVEALDVRAGGALIIAACLAKGRTEITGVDHIERGYEDIIGRLKKVGVNIELIQDE